MFDFCWKRGKKDYTVKVGQSILLIHLLRKFLIPSDPVVVDGSSRSEGGAHRINLYVLACHKRLIFNTSTRDQPLLLFYHKVFKTSNVPDHSSESTLADNDETACVGGVRIKFLPTYPCIPTKQTKDCSRSWYVSPALKIPRVYACVDNDKTHQASDISSCCKHLTLLFPVPTDTLDSHSVMSAKLHTIFLHLSSTRAVYSWCVILRNARVPYGSLMQKKNI